MSVFNSILKASASAVTLPGQHAVRPQTAGRIGQPPNPYPQLIANGTNIDGYRVINLIAKGGMGEVYLVEKEGRNFALKIANDENFETRVKLPMNERLREFIGRNKSQYDYFDQDGALVVRGQMTKTAEEALFDIYSDPAQRKNIAYLFQQSQRGRKLLYAEAVLLGAHIGEANLPKLDSMGEYQGDFYFVMEVAEGEELSDLLAKKGQFTEKEALTAIYAILNALEALHSQGSFHHDIKPGNVRIVIRPSSDPIFAFDPNGVILLDLGIGAAKIGGAFRQDTITGTPPYIAPETARGAISDYRADFYSLGVLLYELITGHTPFQGNDAQQLHAHLFISPPEDPKLTGYARTLVRTALQKDPAKRFATVGEMKERVLLALRNIRAQEEKTEKARKAATFARLEANVFGPNN